MRPSPSMVVALVALFVAMSGVGYAAATIGSGQIKNNSVRGKDIRNSSVTGKDVKNNGLTGKDLKSIKGGDVTNNSLTGSDVNEASLAKVPSAGTADTAGTANSAGSTGGVAFQKISFNVPAGTGNTSVLNFGGLELTARCEADGNLVVFANPSSAALNNSLIYGNNDLDSDDSDFDRGDDESVIDQYGTPYEGTLQFRASNGQVVVVNLLMQDDDNTANPPAERCQLYGIAQATTS